MVMVTTMDIITAVVIIGTIKQDIKMAVMPRKMGILIKIEICGNTLPTKMDGVMATTRVDIEVITTITLIIDTIKRDTKTVVMLKEKVIPIKMDIIGVIIPIEMDGIMDIVHVDIKVIMVDTIMVTIVVAVILNITIRDIGMVVVPKEMGTPIKIDIIGNILPIKMVGIMDTILVDIIDNQTSIILC